MGAVRCAPSWRASFSLSEGSGGRGGGRGGGGQEQVSWLPQENVLRKDLAAHHS